MLLIWVLIPAAVLVVLYLFHVSRAMKGAPPDAVKIAGRTWSEEEIKEAYEKCRTEPIDFSKLLPPKTGRRYIVFGGSGLVGGWIVQHLLERGESPAAIRIADLAIPRRAAIVDSKVQFHKTDISDPIAVSEAFHLPWPPEFAAAPLTVFHTAAYVNPSERFLDFLPKYLSINVEGTRHILAAARAAGCSVLVSTSSASICLRPVNYFIWPWSKQPQNWFQVSDNAEPENSNAGLENFIGCYAYSKARGEKLVLQANSKGFRTGVIRPGHAIYGHGEQSPSSVSHYYLSKGETTTWLAPILTQFVSAQNVSLAHIQFEHRLITPETNLDISGRAYAITDPGPPILYGQLYAVLSTLAHKATPASFPALTPLPFLILSHIIERYTVLQYRYLSFLPPARGDLKVLQPALWSACTVNTVYTTQKAINELGFRSPLGTLEGLCLHLKEWNDKIEMELEKQRTC